jgi:hypothetical protein
VVEVCHFQQKKIEHVLFTIQFLTSLAEFVEDRTKGRNLNQTATDQPSAYQMLLTQPTTHKNNNTKKNNGEEFLAQNYGIAENTHKNNNTKKIVVEEFLVQNCVWLDLLTKLIFLCK